MNTVSVDVNVTVTGEIHRHGDYQPVTSTEYRRCGGCRKGVWRFWVGDQADEWVHPAKLRSSCRSALADDNTFPDERHQ